MAVSSISSSGITTPGATTSPDSAFIGLLALSLESIRGFDAENRAVVFVGEQVQELVRTLPHVANSLPQIHEQHLAPQLFHVLVEQDPLQMPGAGDLAHAHAADEHVALPLRQLAARVEG